MLLRTCEFDWDAPSIDWLCFSSSLHMWLIYCMFAAHFIRTHYTPIVDYDLDMMYIFFSRRRVRGRWLLLCLCILMSTQTLDLKSDSQSTVFSNLHSDSWRWVVEFSTKAIMQLLIPAKMEKRLSCWNLVLRVRSLWVM